MKTIFDQVWRDSIDTGSGYYLLDAGVLSSQALRKRMFEIKDMFNEFQPFGIYSLTRFDQQETTRFHQDGGPDFNILILGYEPSNVRSRLYIADHVRAANASSVTTQHIISEAMYGGEDFLVGHIMKLPYFKADHSYILIINNSKELGVMHKAIIDKNPKELRIVNSIMLNLGKDEISEKEQQQFLINKFDKSK